MRATKSAMMGIRRLLIHAPPRALWRAAGTEFFEQILKPGNKGPKLAMMATPLMTTLASITAQRPLAVIIFVVATYKQVIKIMKLAMTETPHLMTDEQQTAAWIPVAMEMLMTVSYAMTATKQMMMHATLTACRLVVATVCAVTIFKRVKMDMSPATMVMPFKPMVV